MDCTISRPRPPGRPSDLMRGEATVHDIDGEPSNLPAVALVNYASRWQRGSGADYTTGKAVLHSG